MKRAKRYKVCEVTSRNGDVHHFPLELIPGTGRFLIDIPAAVSVRIVRMTARVYFRIPECTDSFPPE